MDIDGRTSGLNQHNSTGYKVNAHEIAAALSTRRQRAGHGVFRPARGNADSFGYRFDAPDRVIVISGDTAPTPALIDHSRGCDVLVHEAYSMASYHQVSPRSQQFRRTHHTSTIELRKSRTR